MSFLHISTNLFLPLIFWVNVLFGLLLAVIFAALHVFIFDIVFFWVQLVKKGGLCIYLLISRKFLSPSFEWAVLSDWLQLHLDLNCAWVLRVFFFLILRVLIVLFLLWMLIDLGFNLLNFQILNFLLFRLEVTDTVEPWILLLEIGCILVLHR